ncbi:MAG: phosphatase PAP2 family protein [Candidatus Izemoplasmatales bacterium]|jgi:membrane-associated phospholipid phosphatase|nr:phosphatase PAP2 family protein [Candidatus Izemoplasmatales bacterium]MDD4987260.1 phosphatase PAP2 family protein [Candidatus Izemoplasmatales bacterium]MDD5601631.1 phosphatase PAP2 family protein [Candidatus Izemoplasmatales bacterium]MDY0372615.1 phosphatase PAP2 family protein [Candidatus Izemoplasmatales bacterium]NLF49011.1 phosphatase PAP2 family protein [Acholeplasmataceae bacterium]
MNKKRITYALIPFAVVGIMLFITYFGNQWYAESAGIIGTDLSVIFLKFNQWVPFIPETVYIYVIAYPFWIFSFFYVAYYSKKGLYTLMVLILITFTVCGLWYLFAQTDVQSWRETSGLFDRDPASFNLTEKLVWMIYNSAGPRNANPSMHCLMSWLSIIGARIVKDMPKPGKIMIWVIGIAICISTQTMKQHYIIDLITGIILGEATYWLIIKTPLARWVERFFTRINQKVKLDWNGDTTSSNKNE